MKTGDKGKRRRQRLEKDRALVLRILSRHGAAGAESRAIALIAELESNYVTRLLVSLRNQGLARSEFQISGYHRWMIADASPAPAVTILWRDGRADAPLPDLDREHEQWTRKILAPKPRFNPCGGGK